MTNQDSNHNELVAEDGLAVSFEDDRNAYNARTVLKELDSQRRVSVQEAVVVVRGEDGRVVEKDKGRVDLPPQHRRRRWGRSRAPSRSGAPRCWLW